MLQKIAIPSPSHTAIEFSCQLGSNSFPKCRKIMQFSFDYSHSVWPTNRDKPVPLDVTQYAELAPHFPQSQQLNSGAPSARRLFAARNPKKLALSGKNIGIGATSKHGGNRQQH